MIQTFKRLGTDTTTVRFIVRVSFLMSKHVACLAEASSTNIAGERFLSRVFALMLLQGAQLIKYLENFDLTFGEIKTGHMDDDNIKPRVKKNFHKNLRFSTLVQTRSRNALV